MAPFAALVRMAQVLALVRFVQVLLARVVAGTNPMSVGIGMGGATRSSGTNGTSPRISLNGTIRMAPV